MKEFCRIFAGILTIVGSTGIATADVSSADCESLSTTLEILLNLNLELTEYKKNLAFDSMEKLIDAQTSSKAAIEREAMQSILDDLSAIEVDAKELLPGVLAYRKYCE